MTSKTGYNLLPLLLVLALPSTSAQTWLVDGKAWVYNWSWWGSGGYEALTVLPGETVINGIGCKTVASHLHYAYYNHTANSYEIIDETKAPYTICESGDSVWLVHFNGLLELQYDFSMLPGDTLVYTDGLGPRYKLVLDSVGTVHLQNQVLRTQFFTGHRLAPGAWPELQGVRYKVIETIGLVESTGDLNQLSYLLPSYLFQGYADQELWSLRCALDAAYEYKLVDDCYGLVLDASEAKAALAAVEIYPNPAHDAIYISPPNGVVLGSARVYDLHGKLVQESKQPSATLSVGQLAQGTYLLVAQTGQGVVRRRFFKF